MRQGAVPGSREFRVGKVYESIDARIRKWIGKQHMFFVATAPLAGTGSVNLSPKGYDTLRVLDDNTLAFLDYGGSGVETIAHVRENGRIVIMMCSFSGRPKIYRFHGRGSVVMSTDEEFAALAAKFDRTELGVRAIVRVDVERISDSCGYGVPFYDYRGQRPTSVEHIRDNGADDIREYLKEKNPQSIDGLPGISAEEAEAWEPPVDSFR